MEVFYADSLFRSYVKDELIGFTEFLSNTGGLLGLFMGFSVLSVVEILYFITLRPYCRRYYGGKHSKNASSKKVDTISGLVSKNQRHWPFAWTHAQNVDQKKNNNSMLQQAYNRRHVNHPNGQTNGWKAPTPTIVYPYLD